MKGDHTLGQRETSHRTPARRSVRWVGFGWWTGECWDRTDYRCLNFHDWCKMCSNNLQIFSFGVAVTLVKFLLECPWIFESESWNSLKAILQSYPTRYRPKLSIQSRLYASLKTSNTTKNHFPTFRDSSCKTWNVATKPCINFISFQKTLTCFLGFSNQAKERWVASSRCMMMDFS